EHREGLPRVLHGGRQPHSGEHTGWECAVLQRGLRGVGEAETGPMATSWHANKFLNPVHDGAVLPILHLNGYKIASPTVLARISHNELEELFQGYGYRPYFVEGDDPAKMHQLMA